MSVSEDFVRVCQLESKDMTDYYHQEEKISNDLTVVSSMLSGGRLFNSFLLLALVYSEPVSQKKKVRK